MMFSFLIEDKTVWICVRRGTAVHNLGGEEFLGSVNDYKVEI